ncbi:MAG TPA: hypothetical protein O0X42_01340 [Methanocorpusculum sp.]|nr:hypothetical protein [Methanocorpusculum sp.]
MKKIIISGIIAILIAGFLISAGCVSNGNGITAGSDAEKWVNQESDKVQTLYLNSDKTGCKITTEYGMETKNRPFTWEENGPYITLIFADYDVDTMTLRDGCLVHDGHIYTSTNAKPHTTAEPVQDSAIVGTWVFTESDGDTKTLTFSTGGNGEQIKEDDKKIKTKDFTWKKTGSKYYTLFFEDSDDDTLVYENGVLYRDGEIYRRVS